MFSPIPVVTADIDATYTYFLQATAREIDADEVNLSLVLWSGAVGDGDSIQGAVSTEPAYVFPHQNCFHTQMIWRTGANPAFDTRSMWAYVPEHANLLSNQWTVAMWFRPDSLNATDMSSPRSSSNPDGASLHLLSRLAIRKDGTNYQANSFQIIVAGLNDGAGGHLHEIQIKAFPENGINGSTRSVEFGHAGATTGSDDDVSAGLFSWGGAGTATNAQNDAWYFLVICFEGGDFVDDSPSKIRAYMNSATNPTGGAPTMVALEPSGTDGFEQTILQDDTDTMAYNLSAAFSDGGGNIAHNVTNGQYIGNLRTPGTQGDMQVHQLGLWNIALDRGTVAGSNLGLGGLVPIGLKNGVIPNSPIDYLFNKGHGTLIDWKKPGGVIPGSGPSGLATTLYSQNVNLCHLIQFGAVEQAMSSGFPGRDTGYHVYQGDLNFTGTTPEGRYQKSFNYAGDPPGEPATADSTGEHWTDNTSIADILSPEGTNGTTKFNKCYPGQNL